jgi:hypothetical protein
MKDFAIKIIVYLTVIGAVLFGAKSAYDGYTEMKANEKQAVATINHLNSEIERINRVKETNELILKEQLRQTQQAFESSHNQYVESEKRYSQLKVQHSEKISYYTTRLRDADLRLRDPYSAGNTNNCGIQGSTERTDQVGAASERSNGATSHAELSRGFSEYLITRAIQADTVVAQLDEVQDYAKKQRTWILENCNAIE